MSDMGAIMDALVAVAETVSGVTAERTLKYPDEVGAGNFPFACIYDPDEEAELGEFQLTAKKTTVSVLLHTKDETQDEILTKMDSFRDAIAADRTLGGIVQFAHVASRALLENFIPSVTEGTKSGVMTVETIDQTGKIITLVIETVLELTTGFDNWENNDDAFELFVNGHVGSATRLSSNLRADHDTIPVSARRYQMKWSISEHNGKTSNAATFNAAMQIKIHYHMAPDDSELTVLYGTNKMLAWADGLINPANWRALAAVHEVLEDTPTLALDDLERVD